MICRGTISRALTASVLAALVLASPAARADDTALVRVIAEEAQVHTGPGFGFRVVYTARMNEVLPAIGRASHDHWFRVELPDGTYGWILGGDGMFMFRPSWLLAPHVSLEASLGETVGNQVDVFYAGGGFNAFLFASSPVTPFVGVAAGGAFGRKKADQYTIQPGNYSMFNVGGGLIVALKKRLTLRGDVRQYVIYNANHTQQIQEYSGALSVYF